MDPFGLVGCFLAMVCISVCVGLKLFFVGFRFFVFLGLGCFPVMAVVLVE